MKTKPADQIASEMEAQANTLLRIAEELRGKPKVRKARTAAYKKRTKRAQKK